jgi:DnaJ-domain-containing protein 1
MSISRCPRCAEFSYEQLWTHGYCINCNHSEDLKEDGESTAEILAWACQVVDGKEVKGRKDQNDEVESLSNSVKRRFEAAAEEWKQQLEEEQVEASL